MADEVKVYVVEFRDRPNYQLQWRDPITQKLRTKTTTVKRTGLARDRKVAERLAGLPVLLTRLARGLTVGASLEQANRDMLADALAGRQKY